MKEFNWVFGNEFQHILTILRMILLYLPTPPKKQKQKKKNKKKTSALKLTYDGIVMISWLLETFNTLRPRQNGRHFPDDIFKCIFLNETVWISITISLKFVPTGPIKNIPALVQIMAWRRPGDKPLSEPMIVRLLTHICVTRPQSVLISIHPFSIQFPLKRRHHFDGFFVNGCTG